MPRLAIIGTGQSVGNHLTAVKALGDRVELVAAVDTDEGRVNAICAENNIPRAYTSTAAMLEAERPDLVNIVTPSATHKELVIACLEAGAWVYCEKPLCASLAEFDEITRAEQRTGNYVSTVFQWRFGSAAKHLKQLIADNALGRPLVAMCETLWYRTQDYYNVPWRARWETAIGGPTVTLGIHLMDLFLWLLDDWQEIYARMGTLDRSIEVEDVSMALVQFKSGAMGTIVNSALSPRQTTSLRLDFQQATIELNALYRYTNENWRISIPDNATNTEPLRHWQAMSANISGRHETQLSEILDCMTRNERPPASGEDARRIVEFIACLYKSAATRQPVQRGQIGPDDPFYHAMNTSLLEAYK